MLTNYYVSIAHYTKKYSFLFYFKKKATLQKKLCFNNLESFSKSHFRNINSCYLDDIPIVHDCHSYP